MMHTLHPYYLSFFYFILLPQSLVRWEREREKKEGGPFEWGAPYTQASCCAGPRSPARPPAPPTRWTRAGAMVAAAAVCPLESYRRWLLAATQRCPSVVPALPR
jgi:hypothetical protein